MIRTYEELTQLKTFEERVKYLMVPWSPLTFGNDRWINQLLYSSDQWKRIRRSVILRDNGWDLGVEGRDIGSVIFVHHMNPITVDDIVEERPIVFDKRYLITTCKTTHEAIHHSDERILFQHMIERKPNDTCPWKGGSR